MAQDQITGKELIARYWLHAETYYRDPNGNVSRELENIRDAVKPVKRLFAMMQALKFEPRALRTVRQKMIEAGLGRRNINCRIGRVKRVFRWAASEELIPGEVYYALLSVEGLRHGRCEANEGQPVHPVSVSLGNGLTQSCGSGGNHTGLDQFSWIIDLSYATGGPPVCSYEYGYDPAGNRLFARVLQPNHNNGWSYIYTYDASGETYPQFLRRFDRTFGTFSARIKRRIATLRYRQQSHPTIRSALHAVLARSAPGTTSGGRTVPRRISPSTYPRHVIGEDCQPAQPDVAGPIRHSFYRAGGSFLSAGAIISAVLVTRLEI